ncbi:hypothetical protein ACFWNK_38315, partial [Streptomyces sp. NPDC058417]|uniref:hypothetical protein n=1 Tax=unclassified Streptomyces TaxID=2593676 RepID=UPI0036632164
PPTNPSPDRSSSSASTDQHHNKISPTLNQPWGQARWTMRWKTALNAFDITFDGRLSAARQ